jgi:hypothetical protein
MYGYATQGRRGGGQIAPGPEVLGAAEKLGPSHFCVLKGGLTQKFYGKFGILYIFKKVVF